MDFAAHLCVVTLQGLVGVFCIHIYFTIVIGAKLNTC
jgi:hypothetical protein